MAFVLLFILLVAGGTTGCNAHCDEPSACSVIGACMCFKPARPVLVRTSTWQAQIVCSCDKDAGR